MRHGIRQHAVESDRGQQQRESREGAQQDRLLLSIGHVEIDDVLHCSYVRHRLIGIHRRDDSSDGLSEVFRAPLHPDGQVFGQRPRPWGLRIRQVDARLHGELVAALVDVLHNADYREQRRIRTAEAQSMPKG